MLLTLLALVLCIIPTACNGVEFRDVLAIAGNFSLNGKLTNLAQYDVTSGIWSNSYEAELYVYGESYGVVWDTSVNRSTPSDELIVVGAFDTVSTTSSQVQYCSVGVWTGMAFKKMGEGLCPRGGGSSSDMMIQASVLGDAGDLFVGGSFDSRVWDGNQFVDIHDVAYFKGSRAAWLPLAGGQLSCDTDVAADCLTRVSALAWDSVHQMLFIGGRFDMLHDERIPGSVCVWTEAKGLKRFPTRGIGFGLSPDVSNGEVTHMAFEPQSESLFVSGLFSYINNEPCQSVAVWYRASGEWLCLNQQDRSISTVTAMTLDAQAGRLYLAGWASFQAHWSGGAWGSPYAISWANVSEYIAARSVRSAAPSREPTRGGHDRGKGHRDSYVHGRRVSAEYSNRPRATVPGSRTDTRSRDRRVLNSVLSEPSRGGDRAYTDSNTTHRRISSKQFIYSNWMDRRRSSTNNSRNNSEEAKMAYIHRQQLLRRRHRRTSSDAKNSFSIPWDWLPGFSGGNGPIFGIAVGRHHFADCLFIAGAFNNGPPIVMWMPASSPETLPRVISVGSLDDNIHGMVTSVAQLVIMVPRAFPVQPPDDEPELSFATWIVISSCILIGIFLGIVFTVRCSRNPYFRIPSANDLDGIVQPESDMPQMSLEILGGTRTDIDLQGCYRRAMSARHLTTDEALVLIKPDEIRMSKIIGEGSFGRVWSGSWRNNKVAVKEFVFAQAALTGGSQHVDSIVEEIIGEAGIMTCLRHPKILQLFGCSVTMQAVWIVCELCDRGSLRMVLNDPTVHLSPVAKASLCLDIADGMMYLHRRKPPIIHRDLKTHNVFITERSAGKYIAKIGDWGSARAIALTKEKTLTQGVGTACWLAPEVILHAHYSKESDVYAFGIVLWEIFTRQDVYPHFSAAQIIAKVANERLRPPVPLGCPWEDIMRRCWSQRPIDRPHFGDVIAVFSEIYSNAKVRDKSKAGSPEETSPVSHCVHSPYRRSSGSNTAPLLCVAREYSS